MDNDVIAELVELDRKESQLDRIEAKLDEVIEFKRRMEALAEQFQAGGGSKYLALFAKMAGGK
jgi:hypothetical protein